MADKKKKKKQFLHQVKKKNILGSRSQILLPKYAFPAFNNTELKSLRQVITVGANSSRAVPTQLLKGDCHSDSAVCWPKLVKYLIENLISNVKLPLEHQEQIWIVFFQVRSVFSNFSKMRTRNLKNLALFFQVAILFHPTHPQPRMNDASFFAFVGLLLTKLNHYF